MEIVNKTNKQISNETQKQIISFVNNLFSKEICKLQAPYIKVSFIANDIKASIFLCCHEKKSTQYLFEYEV